MKITSLVQARGMVQSIVETTRQEPDLHDLAAVVEFLINRIEGIERRTDGARYDPE